ncbi:MAG: maleylpyruvate isomerase family mycothiol-dependent enzyme [Acidimicrobiales bacterium]
MDVTTYLAHLRADSDALLAAYQTSPTEPVVPCPGWDRAALLGHLGRTHEWVRLQAERGPGERVRFGETANAPEEAAMSGWFSDGVSQLIEALGTMDLAVTWPTWAGPQPGTFYPRRMAHETAVHRRDAEPAPFDPALAVDGLDELLEHFAPLAPADELPDEPRTIHLHATDTEGEWLVRLGPDRVTFEHGHAKGDVALRGSAGDLLLWGWNRVPVDDRFEVFGDARVLDLWRTAVAI